MRWSKFEVHFKGLNTSAQASYGGVRRMMESMWECRYFSAFNKWSVSIALYRYTQFTIKISTGLSIPRTLPDIAADGSHRRKLFMAFFAVFFVLNVPAWKSVWRGWPLSHSVYSHASWVGVVVKEHKADFANEVPEDLFKWPTPRFLLQQAVEVVRWLVRVALSLWLSVSAYDFFGAFDELDRCDGKRSAKLAAISCIDSFVGASIGRSPDKCHDSL